MLLKGEGIMIRLVKRSDIDELAKIYKDLYDNVDIGENWTIERASSLLKYWYDKQKDLFFVYEENSIPLGAVVSGVKSWFDGFRLIDTEIFVSKKCQNKHVGKKLMLAHLKEAKIKYNVKMIEFHTYGNEDEFPQNWYNRIGFKKDNELIIMNADVEEVLSKLGWTPNIDKYDTNNDNVVNLSYADLIDLYSSLKCGDTAYIFDMLPPYAYLDNDLENKYVQSRITAANNGAKVNLFIIGNKKKFDSLKDNKLFKKTMENCIDNNKIYVIDEENIKEKCSVEFFQLANGLYFGERADGSKEAFRDLWSNSNNIGILIKDYSTLTYIEECINTIIEKINNGEIRVENIKA